MLRGWRSIAYALVLVAAAVPCSAQTDPPASERARAAALFEQGMRTFGAGDFRAAADAFEGAYRLAPTPDALWNAARAWDRGGEIARAATLYARYLREAPLDARDRGAATSYLTALSRKLARIEIHGDALVGLEVDGVSTPDHVIYVSRGTHVVTATADGALLRKEEKVEAGDLVSVVLEPSAGGATVPSTRSTISSEAGDREGAPDGQNAGHSRWSPWVFVGGAVLTSVAVAFTIASGIDTDNARDTWEESKTAANLSSGRAKELRTNVLLATSLVLGAATAAVGIWAVDWHAGAHRVQAGLGLPVPALRDASERRLGPPSVRLRWTF